VAREAAKQCGRAVIPDVEAPRPLPAWLDEVQADVRLCLWEGAGDPLLDALEAAPSPRSVALMVGPEGGLARAETEAAAARGWRLVRCGPRILRTETAGPALVAIVQFRHGDLAAAAPPSRDAGP
jgi:16S rRNA (uracil1498-N3)-methyltransferase